MGTGITKLHRAKGGGRIAVEINFGQSFNIIVLGAAVVLFGTTVITMTPVATIWLLILFVSAVILSIILKQIRTLGTVGIIIIAIYSAPLLAAGYTNLSPQLASAGASVARLYCATLLFGAILFNMFYKSHIQDQAESVLSGLNISIPHRAKTDLDNEEITHPSVELCRKASNPSRKIGISGKDRYLHTLLIGSTGTGKTSAVLQPSVWQDLVSYKNGQQLGITIVAPDAEFCHTVRDWCKTLEIPFTIIDLDDPDTCKFNPLEGEPIIVAGNNENGVKSNLRRAGSVFCPGTGTSR